MPIESLDKFIEPTPELKNKVNNLRVIVMAGGRGIRLESITKGLIPKDFIPLSKDGTKRGIDHTMESLNRIGLTDVIYSVNYYYDIYAKEFAGTKVKLHYQDENDSHGIDLHKIITTEGGDKQYLILPTDVLFHPSDLRNLILAHQPGTITRGVSLYKYKEMEPYYRTYVDPTKKAIVGVDGSPFQKKAPTITTEKVVGSPIMIIDPTLYQKLFKFHSKYTHKESKIDLYLDILWLTTEWNKRRVESGRDPILFAHMFDHAHIDFGTPTSLSLARDVYDSYNSSL